MAAIPNSIPPQAFSNSHSWHHLRPPHQIKNQHQTPRNQHQGPPTPNRNPNRPSAHPRPPHLPTRPQCQLCGKFGHTVMKCYHHFDITYQDNNGASSSRDSSQFQAMLVAAPEHQDSWFFDIGDTHHLTHSAQTLSHVQPYSGVDQVTIGDGQSLPIHNIGNKLFPFPSKVLCLNQVLHVPQLSTNLISVSKICTDNAIFF